MYKTEYDELRIKGIIEILQNDNPLSVCAEEIKKHFKFLCWQSYE
ncbi:hypothetical protein [Enterococcus faecalis]|nr:hypothetical protein [Enterococcus faecalis]